MSFEYPEMNDDDIEVCRAYEEYLELREEAAKSLPNVIKYVKLLRETRKARLKHAKILKEYNEKE